MKLSTKKIIFSLVPLAIVVIYLATLNIYVLPKIVLIPENVSCPSKITELPGVLYIYGNYSLDHGVLCYTIALSKYWDYDPATPLILVTRISRYDAPWYLRGYSVEVSSIRVFEKGLPDYMSIWYVYRDGLTSNTYTFEVKAYIGGYIARKYSATLYIALRVKITEWSILGPLKTYEFNLLNKTIPITIDVKYVWWVSVLKQLISSQR